MVFCVILVSQSVFAVIVVINMFVASGIRTLRLLFDGMEDLEDLSGASGAEYFLGVFAENAPCRAEQGIVTKVRWMNTL